MDYLPPGHIRGIGDKRFPRFLIKRWLGQYLVRRGARWRTSHARRCCFVHGDRRNGARNRHCLGGDAADTFTVTVDDHRPCQPLVGRRNLPAS